MELVCLNPFYDRAETEDFRLNLKKACIIKDNGIDFDIGILLEALV